MKLDIYHALYTVGMILLAFVAAMVVTKTISNYINKNKDKKDEL